MKSALTAFTLLGVGFGSLCLMLKVMEHVIQRLT